MAKKNESATQRKRRLEKEKLKRAEKKLNETASQRQIRLEKDRAKRNSRTSSQRERASVKAKETREKKKRDETNSQKQKRLANNRERQKERRNCEHEENRSRLTANRHNVNACGSDDESMTTKERRLLKQRELNKKNRNSESEVRKEQRLQKQRELSEQIRASESEIQREQRLQKQRELSKQIRASESENQREQRLQKLRELSEHIRASESEIQREQRLQKLRESSKQIRASESEVQREQRLQKLRESSEQIRASESEVKREQRLQKQRELNQQILASESEVEKEKRLETQHKLDVERRAHESPEHRSRRLQVQHVKDAERRFFETVEDRNHRLDTQNKLDSQRRANEPSWARDHRLETQHQLDVERRACETPESHEQRLQRQKVLDTQIRLQLRSLDNSVEGFIQRVSVYADKICDSCDKCCYPNQVSNFQLTEQMAIQVYLPERLKIKQKLLLCYSCKDYLKNDNVRKFSEPEPESENDDSDIENNQDKKKKTKKKKKFSVRKKKDRINQPLLGPPKAYWNKLRPGDIPPELSDLSELEIRFIARVVTFIKIFRLDAEYGQFGFKGQALLFAQDIEEVYQNLPTDLPRSANDIGLVIVTEKFENLNKSNRFTVDRDRLYRAIEWLKKNNKLYKDVRNEARSMKEIKTVDFARVHEPPPRKPPKRTVISEFSEIIRGQWNQEDPMFGESAGNQCTVIAIGAIMRAKTLAPALWDSNNINEILIESNQLYEEFINFIGAEKPILLRLNDFPTEEHYQLYGDVFSLKYSKDPEIYGSLIDKHNQGFQNAFNFSIGLQQFFAIHQYGILIANGKSFAVMNDDGKYYIYNPFACGPKGASAKSIKTGRACLIQCSQFEEFVKICKKSIGPKNKNSRTYQYTLDYLNLNIEEQDSDHQIYSGPLPVDKDEDDYAVILMYGEWNIDSNRYQENAGNQSCAMALGALIYARIEDPLYWDPSTINYILDESNEMYKKVLEKSDSTAIQDDKHLCVRSFGVIREDFHLFGKSLQVDFHEDPILYGTIEDEDNISGAVDITTGLNLLLEAPISGGIFTVNNENYAVFRNFEDYFFFNPRPCYIQNNEENREEKSCLHICKTIKGLVRCCEVSSLSLKPRTNTVYTLDHINLTFKDVIDHSDMLEVEVEGNDDNGEKADEVADENEIPVKVVVGNFHQGDHRFGRARSQCCAMSIGAIIYSQNNDPANWNSKIMDHILLSSDGLHRDVKNRLSESENPTHDGGFLRVNNFNVIKDEIKIFDETFSISYDPEPFIYGNLIDEQNSNGVGFDLRSGIETLFLREYDNGVLISNGKSFAVMKKNEKFYLFNSHSCDLEGNAVESGYSCLIRFQKIEALVEYVKKAATIVTTDLDLQSFDANAYTLDRIDVKQIIQIEPYYETLENAEEPVKYVNGTFHQGDERFNDNFHAGVQCCAMSIGAIIFAETISDICVWNTRNLDSILTSSHDLYENLVALLEVNGVERDGSGYLRVNEFDAIKDEIAIFDTKVALQYDSDPAIYGSLVDSENLEDGLGVSLIKGLTDLFSHHDYGVFISRGKCFAIMKQENKFYFFDSHSCDSKGNSSFEGSSCLIELQTIELLEKCCKRAAVVETDERIVRRNPDINIYTIDFINVVREGHMKIELKFASAVESTRTIQAKMNLTDKKFGKTSGKQYLACAISSIIYGICHYPVKFWDSSHFHKVINESNELHNSVLNLCDQKDIQENGYLRMTNFNVIKNNMNLFGERSTIAFQQKTPIFGYLNDEFNGGLGTVDFTTGISMFLSNHWAAVLISNDKCLAIVAIAGIYYLINPHECDERGQYMQDGFPIVITCDNLEKLIFCCRRAVGDRNTYLIHPIYPNLFDESIANVSNIPEDLKEGDKIEIMPLTSEFLSIYTFLEMQIREESEQREQLCNKKIRHKVHVNDRKKKLDSQSMSRPDAFDINSDEEQFDSIQTYVMAAIDPRQPQIDHLIKGMPKDDKKSCPLMQITRKTDKNIVNTTYELKAEEYAWYTLFPYGVNGLREDRKVPISTLDYFQSRIMGADKRFQSNDYLFYALSMYEADQIFRTIHYCGKKVQHKNKEVEDIQFYMKKLRGSSAYWTSAFYDVLAMVRCLGPPHFFITLSCNDLGWPDMLKALLIADGHPDVNPETLTASRAQKLVESYPVVLERHFMFRFNAMLKDMKANPDWLGGEIEDFFYRVEFQQRGSPHIHMIIWIKGMPSFDTAEGIAVIDRVVTCALPEDPGQREMVERYQRHSHRNCLTYKQRSDRSTSDPKIQEKAEQLQNEKGRSSKKAKKQREDGECRFAFPRQTCERTHMAETGSDECIKNGGRIWIMRRTEEEVFINNYNPEIFFRWQANMDIQICGSNEEIVAYLLKYCTKPETLEVRKQTAESIKKIRNEDTPIGKKLAKQAMKILSFRQVGACEAAHRLCHLKFRESSRKIVTLVTHRPSERYASIKFIRDNATDFCTSIIDRYMQRPTDHENYNFERMSLMEFAMLFEPQYKKNVNDEDDEEGDQDAYDAVIEPDNSKSITLLNNMKMRIRRRPAVVRVYSFNVSTDPEGYYYSLLLQYLPFRDESELMRGFDTAREAFMAREEDLRASSRDMEMHRARDRLLEDAINQVRAFIPLEEDDEDVQHDDNFEENEISNDDFETTCRSMNGGQRKLFNYITKSIADQMAGRAKSRIRLFITGGAGTGKTFTLNLLRHQIYRCYGSVKDTVKVAALTGVAAKLASGRTLHSLFKFAVQKDGKIPHLTPLTGKYLTTIRAEFRPTKFLIIDEISMVSYELLTHINSRLQQIFDNNELFGGINVLFFGDLMQLPPVRGSPVFQQPNRLAATTHLWQTFSLWELTENMRQQNDTTFIDLLNNLRVGELNTDQIALLLSKNTTNFSNEFSIGEALRIDPINKLVAQHNAEALQFYRDHGVEMVNIEAFDRMISGGNREYTKSELEALVPEDSNKTGAFPKSLTLFVGAKVMLRYNVATERGLVNGSIGNISEIIWPLFRREQMHERDIPSVRIIFEGIGEHIIRPREVDFPAKNKKGTIRRYMLPLVLCWASSVHKMQGATVDRAVIHLGPELFAKGQAYVALSRVRSLDGIIISNLDLSRLTKTYCNTAALFEIERMRRLPPPDTEQQPQSENPS